MGIRWQDLLQPLPDEATPDAQQPQPLAEQISIL